MTKDEAKLHVQKLLAQAEGLLQEAGKVMDEHQFSTQFMDRTYFPQGMKLKAYDDEDPDVDLDEVHVTPDSDEDSLSWMCFYGGDYQWLAGEWKSSSEYGNC